MVFSKYDICTAVTSGFGRWPRRGFVFPLMLLMVVFGGIRAKAQAGYSRGGPDVSLSDPAAERDCPERKSESFWFWRRPAGETPDEQWRIARRLVEKSKLRRAARACNALVRSWHEAPEAAEAQYTLARILERREKRTKAFDAYQYLICYYPGEFPHREVVERQFAIARKLAARGQGFWSSGSSKEALRMLKTIVRNAPRSDIGADARLHIGRLHESLGDLDEAILAYNRFVALHPEHPDAPQAAFSAAECRFRISRNYPRDADLCHSALSFVSSIISRYPRHKNLGELEGMETALRDRLSRMYYDQAAFYDSHHGTPRAALIAYEDYLRRFPNSEKSETARRRIQELRRITGHTSPPHSEPSAAGVEKQGIQPGKIDGRHEDDESQ